MFNGNMHTGNFIDYHRSLNVFCRQQKSANQYTLEAFECYM